MKRLTHERCNGIRTGYWSPEKKDELVKALAAYENTGLTPDQIMELKERDTAKAPTEVDEYFGYYECPNCGMAIYASDRLESHKYCLNCGQKLEWEAHE